MIAYRRQPATARVSRRRRNHSMSLSSDKLSSSFVRPTPKNHIIEENSLFEGEMVRPAESASKQNETQDEGHFEPVTIHLYADTESDLDKASRPKSSSYFNLWRIKQHDRHLFIKLSPSTKVLRSKLPKQENGSSIRFKLDAMFESRLLYQKEHGDTWVLSKYIDDSGHTLGRCRQPASWFAKNETLFSSW